MIRVDLLFTDIVMPGGMNGRQVADEALSRRPGLKVLLTTGYSRSELRDQDSFDTSAEMIGTPFSIDALAAKVRSILDEHD
jgi:DNA-binding NtrC family response regulator